MFSRVYFLATIFFVFLLSSCNQGTDGESYVRYDNNTAVSLLKFSSNADIQNYNIDSDNELSINAKGKFFKVLPGNYTCTYTYIENDAVVEKTAVPFSIEIDKGEYGRLLREPTDGNDRYYTLLIGAGGSLNMTYSFSP